jgi:hypothetical protein
MGLNGGGDVLVGLVLKHIANRLNHFQDEPDFQAD